MPGMRPQPRLMRLWARQLVKLTAVRRRSLRRRVGMRRTMMSSAVSAASTRMKASWSSVTSAWWGSGAADTWSWQASWPCLQQPPGLCGRDGLCDLELGLGFCDPLTAHCSAYLPFYSPLSRCTLLSFFSLILSVHFPLHTSHGTWNKKGNIWGALPWRALEVHSPYDTSVDRVQYSELLAQESGPPWVLMDLNAWPYMGSGALSNTQRCWEHIISKST